MVDAALAAVHFSVRGRRQGKLINANLTKHPCSVCPFLGTVLRVKRLSLTEAKRAHSAFERPASSSW